MWFVIDFSRSVSRSSLDKLPRKFLSYLEIYIAEKRRSNINSYKDKIKRRWTG